MANDKAREPIEAAREVVVAEPTEESPPDTQALIEEFESESPTRRLGGSVGWIVAGIAVLLDLLAERAKREAGDAGDILPSRLRHVELLKETTAHVEAAVSGEGKGLELRADDLRRAADRLGRISGAVDVEDLLDVIFSQFCIGK